MTEPLSALPLLQALTGYWGTQALYVACKLQMADHLASGPKSITELAELSSCHAENLHRVLRALATTGIFEETDPQVFLNTEISEFLRSDHPQSLRAFALMHGEPWHWNSWGQLLDSVRTGKTAFETVHQKTLFQYLQDNAQAAQVFDQAMTNLTSFIQPLVEAHDFSQYKTIVDVGGGHGHLIFTILQTVLKKNPTSPLNGALFDLPHVVEKAKMRLPQDLQKRVHFHSGDFFETLPQEADCYLMKYILHDWDDERALRILKNCRQAMPSAAKVIVIEHVIPPGNDFYRGKWTDLEMMALTPGGKERTEEQFQNLFQKAGLALKEVIPTTTAFYLLVAQSA